MSTKSLPPNLTIEDYETDLLAATQLARSRDLHISSEALKEIQTPPNAENPFKTASKIYGQRTSTANPNAKAANYEFPTPEAHQIFKQLCKDNHISQSQMITHLIMEAIKAGNPEWFEEQIQNGIWTRPIVGRPLKIVVDPGSAPKPHRSNASIAAAALIPTYDGIKFPKIPTLLEIKNEGINAAWPSGDLRYPTPKEWENIKEQSTIEGQDALIDTRFIDEIGMYFDMEYQVWHQRQWKGQEDRFTTDGTLVQKWTPKVIDFRVTTYINNGRGGGRAFKVRRPNLRHLFPFEQFDDGPELARPEEE